MKKKFAALGLIVAAFAISASWAGASVILQFNNNPNDTVGGSPETIQAAPGASVVISLQLVSTSQTTASLDYWLEQFSGPGTGVFSITGRDYTGSDFNRPEFGNGVTTTTRDDFSNSQSGGLGNHDGVPDNLLSPRNGPDLGGRFSLDFNPPGTHQVTTFTLTVSLSAQPGLYEIRTFDYPKNGYSEFKDGNFIEHSFDAQGAIKIQVVPEPRTFALLVVSMLGVVATFCRRAFVKKPAA